jgi:annexin A7/11
LNALALGPLMADAYFINEAVKGLGYVDSLASGAFLTDNRTSTNEAVLTEIIMGRSNGEIQLLQQAYRQRYNKDMSADVKDDLSHKTEQRTQYVNDFWKESQFSAVFTMALSASRSEDLIVNEPLLGSDVCELDYAFRGLSDSKKTAICNILVNRSDNHLRAMCVVAKLLILSTCVKLNYDSGFMLTIADMAI